MFRGIVWVTTRASVVSITGMLYPTLSQLDEPHRGNDSTRLNLALDGQQSCLILRDVFTEPAFAFVCVPNIIPMGGWLSRSHLGRRIYHLPFALLCTIVLICCFTPLLAVCVCVSLLHVLNALLFLSRCVASVASPVCCSGCLLLGPTVCFCLLFVCGPLVHLLFALR